MADGAKWQGSKHEETADLRQREAYSYTVSVEFKKGVKVEMGDELLPH